MTGKENGKVEVPRDYFLRMAKLDYNDYKEALAREFFQNSVDARATRIDISFNEDGTIVVHDNGVGMDYDIIRNKLLVLGGSQKREGDTGAFGKAKEVLYFSWENYSVRTQNLLVTGMGADYTIETVEDYHEGTTSTIKLWDASEINNFRYAFQRVAGLFEVSTRIFIADEEIESSMRRGVLARDLGWGSLYVDDTKSKTYYYQVRINGQWMFQSYHGDDGLGQIVLELNVGSTECLNSNRDSLKAEYRQQFSKLVREISVDNKSALQAKNPTVREKYVGTGKVKVLFQKIQDLVQKAIGDSIGTDYIAAEDLDEDGRKEVLNTILSQLPGTNITPRIAEQIATELTDADFNFDPARLSFLGYEPDFVVVHETAQSKEVKKFMKSKNSKVLALAWTAVLKQVLLDTEWYGEFTAGFNFKKDEAAAFERDGDGNVYFYINPTTLLNDVPVKDKKFGPFVRKGMFREDLLTKAIHEIAHLEYDGHNESFSARVDWIRAQTWKSIDLYPTLVFEAFRKE